MGRSSINLRLLAATAIAAATVAVAACGTSASSSHAPAPHRPAAVTAVPASVAPASTAPASAFPGVPAPPSLPPTTREQSAPPVTPAQGFVGVFGGNGDPQVAAKCVVILGHKLPEFTISLRGTGVDVGIQSLDIQFYDHGVKDAVYPASFLPVSVPENGMVTFSSWAAAWPPWGGNPNTCSVLDYNQA